MSEVSTDLTGSEPAFLELVCRSSEPYNDFVYGSRELALQFQRYLFDKRACEFAPPHVWIVRERNDVLGMLAALSGEDLQRCRLRAALASSRFGALKEDPALGRRFQLASQTLLRVQPSDFYISQIAVADSARNQGLGIFLLDLAEREARTRNCRRMVLEVSPSSEAAVRLYQRQAYRLLESRRVADPDSGRSLEFLHMGKDLT